MPYGTMLDQGAPLKVKNYGVVSTQSVSL